jgi:hypothetical protein
MFCFDPLPPFLVGVAMSGLSADARTLVDHARSESQYHRFTYNEPMPIESLTQSICDLALGFGEWGVWVWEGGMSGRGGAGTERRIIEDLLRVTDVSGGQGEIAVGWGVVSLKQSISERKPGATLW